MRSVTISPCDKNCAGICAWVRKRKRVNLGVGADLGETWADLFWAIMKRGTIRSKVDWIWVKTISNLVFRVYIETILFHFNCTLFTRLLLISDCIYRLCEPKNESIPGFAPWAWCVISWHDWNKADWRAGHNTRQCNDRTTSSSTSYSAWVCARPLARSEVGDAVEHFMFRNEV